MKRGFITKSIFHLFAETQKCLRINKRRHFDFKLILTNDGFRCIIKEEHYAVKYMLHIVA